MSAQMVFTPIIRAHMLAALAAALAGTFTLAARKGTRLHRFSGRLWVMLMVVAVLLSFGIRTSGHFSWIHLLSVGTLLVIGRALLAVRRGNIRTHRYAMTGAYAGLLIAGIFTLMPDRRLGYLVWHALDLV